MALREMIALLRQRPGAAQPVKILSADQIFVHFSGERGGEGPCTRGQADSLAWTADVTNYSRMIEWTFDLPPKVTVGDIAAALGVLVARHESLRTTYPAGDPAVQRVASSGELAVNVYEVGNEPPETPVLAGELVRRLRAAEFEVASELPVRAAVAVSRGVPCAAVAVYSHVAADLASMAVIGRQFSVLAGDPARRESGPVGHQPLDQAAAEQSAVGCRRAAAAVRAWAVKVRSMPQFAYAVPPGGPPGGGGTLAGWLWSAAGALALRHIAARTGARRQAAVLAALCAVLSQRTGQARYALTVLTNNRFERRLNEYVGVLAGETLISVDAGAQRFDELVRRTASATLGAARGGLADWVERDHVIREIEDDRGITYTRGCVYNDATVEEPESSTSPGDPSDVLCALSQSELRLVEPGEIWGQLLLFPLLQVEDEMVLGALTADTDRVTRADVESLLRGVESLLTAAAAGDVSLSRIGEITGIPPATRNAGWLLVDSCWIELAEVQRLLDDAVPASAARVFAVPGSPGEPALVAYLAARTSIRTPEQAHAACMATLRGNGRPQSPGGIRYTAMAPGRYVICDGVPGDPSDLAAWQKLPVLADGAGRSRTGHGDLDGLQSPPAAGQHAGSAPPFRQQ